MAKRRTRREQSPPAPEPPVREWLSEVGLLRLVERSVTTPEGHTYPLWDLHPDDVRKLPPGALRADVSRQVFGLGGPVPFYVDRPRRCRTCGKPFVFRAAEQRHWYETLRFLLCSEAVDCPSCRREARRDRARAARHAEVVGAARARPRDAAAQLALAAATCALRERSEVGDIDAGIAAARRARRLDRSLVEALYWEGRLHEEAGRGERARAALTAFLEQAEGVARRAVKTLVRDARDRVSSASTPTDLRASAVRS